MLTKAEAAALSCEIAKILTTVLHKCINNCGPYKGIDDLIEQYTEPYVSREDRDRLLKEMYGPLLEKIKVT